MSINNLFENNSLLGIIKDVQGGHYVKISQIFPTSKTQPRRG